MEHKAKEGNHTTEDTWINIILALNILIKWVTQEIENINQSN